MHEHLKQLSKQNHSNVFAWKRSGGPLKELLVTLNVPDPGYGLIHNFGDKLFNNLEKGVRV
jgi:hypothetical protein